MKEGREGQTWSEKGEGGWKWKGGQLHVQENTCSSKLRTVHM